MASRKIVRDIFISKQTLFRRLLTTNQQPTSATASRLRLLSPKGCSGFRQFSVFDEFSKKVKGEANRDQEFQQSFKELKDKAEELKGAKEVLKARTKKTTEKMYKHVDGVWTEAEARAKKVYANVEEKISAAKEEVKGTFAMGKQEPSGSSRAKATDDSNVNNGSDSASGADTTQQSGPTDTAESLFSKVKATFSFAPAKLSMALQKLKEAKPVDLAKKGYGVVKDELSGNPRRRKHMEYAASSTDSSSKVERSTRTDVAVLESNQSAWAKKWDEFKEKMRGHPLFKRVSGMSEPVVTKSQELAEDVREMWETSDHPVVNKIQDINESVFGETPAAMSFKEIRLRDPLFSLPDFVAEVQEAIRPVLTSYCEGEIEILKKYCSSEVIERCKAEHKAFESQGISFDNKILHISEVDVRETKMMGDIPIIIVVFQTQQVYCLRDRFGTITEGGKDTIHTVYYAWAMQQVSVEELGEAAPHPIWKLREMQQFGVQALI